MDNAFYGVGVGPGDKELVTLKAINIIKNADIIFKPVKEEGAFSVAFDIIEEYIDKQKIIELIFPMVNDQEIRKNYHLKNVDIIKKNYNKGKNCVFVTIGDPTVYATYMYLVKELKQYNINIITIPGITSFTNILSVINEPIALDNESFGIYPMDKDENKINQMIDCHNNIVFMKVYRNREFLYKILKKRGFENKIVIASNIGKENEEISYNIEDLLNENLSYFTTVILKKDGFNE